MTNTPNELFKSLCLESDVYENFIKSIRTGASRQLYIFALKKFMIYRNVKNVTELLPFSSNANTNTDFIIYSSGDIKKIESDIIKWLVYLRDVENLTAITIKGYLSSIKKFYAMNDIIFNNDKLRSYLPLDRKQNDDRGYTREEIVSLLEQCSDQRTRALILLLASTGMRLGGVADSDIKKPYLKLKHLHKIEQYNLYQITVYEGDKEEYICFTTPEAAATIDAYLAYRKRHGEKLTEDSPLFREQFNILDVFDCKNPKAIQNKALAKILSSVITRAGVMQTTKLLEGQKPGVKRNAVARAHGFRKYVITTMQQAGVPIDVIDKQVSHNTSNLKQRHYYRPQVEYLLQEYLKVVDALTINEEHRLRRKVEELTVRADKLDKLEQKMARLDKILGLE